MPERKLISKWLPAVAAIAWVVVLFMPENSAPAQLRLWMVRIACAALLLYWLRALVVVLREPSAWKHWRGLAVLMGIACIWAVPAILADLFVRRYGVPVATAAVLLAVWLCLQRRAQADAALTPRRRLWEPPAIAAACVFGTLGFIALGWGTWYHQVLDPRPTGIFERTKRITPAAEQEMRDLREIIASLDSAPDSWLAMEHLDYRDPSADRTKTAMLLPLSDTIAALQLWLEHDTPLAALPAVDEAGWEHCMHNRRRMVSAVRLYVHCQLASKNYAAVDRIAAACLHGALRAKPLGDCWLSGQLLQMFGNWYGELLLEATRGSNATFTRTSAALARLLQQRDDGWYEHWADYYQSLDFAACTAGAPPRSAAFKAQLEALCVRGMGLRALPYTQALQVEQAWRRTWQIGYWRYPEFPAVTMLDVLRPDPTVELFAWTETENTSRLLLTLYSMRAAEAQGHPARAWWAALPAAERHNVMTGQEYTVDWVNRHVRMDYLRLHTSQHDDDPQIEYRQGHYLEF